jgi:hypothetical protein
VLAGDYAEVPETCPFSTTCRTVCVADVADCPTRCTPPPGDWATFYGLCANGSCQQDCSAITVDDNPCTCPSLPIACPKVVDYYDNCFTEFQTYYDQNDACFEPESYAVAPVRYEGPYFSFCFVWISSVTFFVFAWCFYNEKMCPNTQLTTMPMDSADTSSKSHRKGTYQTGYRHHFVGRAIYAAVVITIAGFQFLLFFLTICYFIQEGRVTRWSPVFEDTHQVYAFFITVWLIGFPWTLAFRFIRPGTHTLFLRRCELQHAAYVAVVTPVPEAQRATGPGGNFSERFSKIMWSPITGFLRFFFSYPYDLPGMGVQYCNVQIDQVHGVRSIWYQHRKYNFDTSSRRYSFGSILVGCDFGDFFAQKCGLNSEEVTRRLSIVGKNCTSLAKPSILSSVQKEFAKPFYVYQNFILWPWFPIPAYQPGIFLTAVRIAGGLLSAYFGFLSELPLYKLSQVTGSVE